jgi:hypothetical protein
MEEFIKLLDEFEQSILIKNKKKMLEFYDKVKEFDLEEIPNYLYEEYDDLTTKANDILYENYKSK